IAVELREVRRVDLDHVVVLENLAQVVAGAQTLSLEQPLHQRNAVAQRQTLVQTGRSGLAVLQESIVSLELLLGREAPKPLDRSMVIGNESQPISDRLLAKLVEQCAERPLAWLVRKIRLLNQS